MTDLLEHSHRSSAPRFTLKALLIAAVFFAGISPTLNWLEFSSGSENLVVETVLEMHRGGPWVIPTLKGAPRTAKPPLTNWISAALVSPSSVAALSDTDHREQAYRRLAWEIRWPALMFACLTLVATAWLGRVLFSDAVGHTAAMMMGSTLLFLRFGRGMTTDVQLALWVTVANVFFALAMLHKRDWLGCLAGGAAVGLALMSKGPVALAQTVAAIVGCLLWMSWRREESSRESHFRWPPILTGAALALAIAAPWPIWVLSRLSGQIGFWWNEITHAGVEDYSSDSPITYLALIPLLLPWVGFFFLGVIILIRQKTASARFVLAMVLVPIVIMSCFKEKNERYLVPMLAPAAVICAIGFVRRSDDLEPIRKWVIAFTWAALAAIAVGLPLAGAMGVTKLDGSRWWSLGHAIIFASAGLLVLIIAWITDPTRRRSLVPVGAVLMIAMQALFMHGYAQSKNGMSDGKPLADAIVKSLPPTAEVRAFTSPGRFFRVPIDFTIYLNRTVGQTSNPTTLPATPQPRAIIVHSRKETDFPPELAGWRIIGTISKNQGTWSACTQPADGSTAPVQSHPESLR